VIAAFAITRAVHFGALLVLFGSQVFSLTLARPIPEAASYALRRSHQIWLVSLAILTAVLLIGFTAGEMSGGPAFDPATMWRVAIKSLFGQVVLARIAILSIVALLLARKTTSVWSALLLVCALAATGLTSHAAASGEPESRLLYAANDAAHLLAAGFWVGGLAVLANALARGARTDVLIKMLQVFSSRGTIAVAVLIVAGIINGILILGKPGMPWSSTYTTLLAIKLVLAAVMVALALANRFSILPGLRSGHAEARESLPLSVAGELVCSVAILLIVGFLGLTAPMAM
jgi:putative copper resistance protein D